MKYGKIKGFTLIELIVVIMIIGVLAAILVPALLGYVGDSKLSTANTNAKLAYTSAMDYCTRCETKGYHVTSSTTFNVDLDSGNLGDPYECDGTQLVEALQSMMEDGQATVVIGDTSVPQKAAWAKTTSDSYVGGYPVPATVKKGSNAGVYIDLATAAATGSES